MTYRSRRRFSCHARHHAYGDMLFAILPRRQLHVPRCHGVIASFRATLGSSDMAGVIFHRGRTPYTFSSRPRRSGLRNGIATYSHFRRSHAIATSDEPYFDGAHFAFASGRAAGLGIAYEENSDY